MEEYKRISVSQAKQMLDAGGVTLVDIRDEQSFSGGRIRSAQSLDNTSAQQFIATADMDAPLIVCCYHGHSSQSAAAWLVSQGFDDVYSLDGGYTEWAQAYPNDCETDPAREDD